MTDKTAIDALKKICSIETGTWDNPVPFSKLYHEAKGIAREALAAIEAEKPAEDAGEWDELTKKEMWETIQEIRTLINSDGTKSIISDIEDYAESYHAEQCTACRKDRQQLPEAPRV